MKRQINQRKAGVLLSYLNLGIGCVIPLLYTPIMLQILGQEEYGVYGLSQSVIGYLTVLNFGMGSAIVRYASRFRAEERTDDVRGLIGLFVLLYSCMAVLVCAIGAFLVVKAEVFFAKGLSDAEIDRLRILMIIMIVSTAISFPISVLASIVSAYERFIFDKTFAIASTLLLPACNLIALYAGHGSVGIAVVGLALQLLNGILYGAFCFRSLGLYPSFRKMPTQLLKEIWLFSAFVFMSSIVDMLYWATDKVLIGALIGSAAVAVYNVGGTFTSMLQNMAHAISNVFAPHVNMMVAKNESPQHISELLIRIGRLQYLVVSLLLSGYIVFGRDFVCLWAGDGYEGAYYVALLTMVPLAVPLIQNIAYTTIVAQNKHRFRSVLYAVIAVINVVSTYLILPYHGIIGAAACTAVSFILGQGIIMNMYYYRVIQLDIPGFWKNIGRMSIVPGLMIAVGFVLVDRVLPMTSLTWLLVWAVVYTVIFAALSWLISMNAYEKQLVGNMLKKVF